MGGLIKCVLHIYLWKSPTMWSQFGAAAAVVVVPVANSRGKKNG